MSEDLQTDYPGGIQIYFRGLHPAILGDQQLSGFQPKAVEGLQSPWWSTVCHPGSLDCLHIEFNGIQSLRGYSYTAVLGGIAVISRGTVIYRDSF